MRAPSSRFVVVPPTLLVLTLASFAQFSQRGSISGVVTEASGVWREQIAWFRVHGSQGREADKAA